MRRLGVLCLAALLCGACSSGGGDAAASTQATTLRPTSTDVTQPIEQLQMKASQATDLLVAHKWAAVVEQFNSQMRAGLTAEGLKTAWAQIEVEFGAYRSRSTTTRVRPSSTDVVFDTPLAFTKMPGKSRITFDRDGKIAGLFILKAEVP
jgi:hypothetical protein